MAKIKQRARKATALLLSALMSVSVLSVAAVLNVGAVSYSEMSALDSQAYSGNDLGASYSKSSTTFKVWAPTASAVKVKLYKTGSDTESGAGVIGTYNMTKGSNAVWSYTASGDLNGTYYTYLVTVNGSTKETVDIYARTTGVNGKRGMVLDLDSTDPSGWDSDHRIDCPNQTDSVIWEVHVRDFSSSADSGMRNKGKYLAFTETGTTVNSDGVHPTGVDYLADLGVTHVHLLPVYDYASVDETQLSTDQFNWGYDPMNYNTPEGSYSTDPYNGEVRVKEFKQMVQSLHNKGIGVVMDVVYNHTYSGGSGINDWFDYTVPGYYYRQDSTGKYSNASGCGNETASDRAMYRKFMIDSLKYWATEYHLDGFRFDLMGIHDCETMNQIRAAMDEIDPQIILYGEPWTATSTTCPTPTAVQGNMGLVSEEVAAFNDQVRDAIKGSCFNAADPGFIQGAGFEEALKASIQANSTSYGFKWSKQPSQTVTYTSAHDNYTLYDKLVKSCKGGSGYGNRYDDLVAMNKLAGGIVLTSQGMSFFQAGEEFARSKYGDENSYKSSTSINQLKWSNTITYSDIVSYYKGLIEIRKAYSPFRDPTNTSNGTIYFSWGSSMPKNTVAYTMYNKLNPADEWDYVSVLHNANNYAVQVTLRTYDEKTLPSQWVVIADGTNAGVTSLGTTGSIVTVPARSTMVLVDKTSFDNTVLAKKGTVTVNHYKKSTNELLKTETLTGKIGTSYQTTPSSALISEGYTLDSVTGAQTGTYSEAGATVNYYYTLDTTNFSTINVGYMIGTGGGAYLEFEKFTGRNGTSYNIQPKSFDGYVLSPDESDTVSGIYGQGDNTYYFVYYAVPEAKLKVHYYNSSSWSKVAMYVYDESGTTTVYHSGTWPGSLMTSEGSGWYVGECNTTDKVKFIANNNNGGSQDPTGVGSSGYDVQGEVYIKNGTVTSAGRVYVVHKNRDTGIVIETEMLGGTAGSAYTTSAKSYDGLKLMNTPSNAAGTYGSDTKAVVYTYGADEPLTATTAVSTGTVEKGQNIKLSATASGGAKPYTYSYSVKKSADSSYTALYQKISSSYIYYSFTEAGNYTVKIDVTDNNGNVVSGTHNVTVTSPSTDLVNTSHTNSDALTVGSRLYLYGEATGGSGSYTYTYKYKRTTSSRWNTLLTENTTQTLTLFTPTSVGTFDIKITASDSAGAAADKTFRLTVVDGKSKAFSNESYLNTHGAKPGTRIFVTGAASGSSGYTYAFYYKRTSARLWTILGTEFGTDNVGVFTPRTEGEFNLKIDIRDANGEIVSRQLALTISDAFSVETTMENYSCINYDFLKPGERLVLMGDEKGGKNPRTYSYYYKKAGAVNWTTIGTEKSSDRSRAVTLRNEGDYIARVIVNDADGAAVAKDFNVTVSADAPGIPALSNETYLAPKTQTGLSLPGITIVCTGCGGKAPYTYFVKSRRSGETEWTNATYEPTTSRRLGYFGSAGDTDVEFLVTVTDSAGTSVDKIIEATLT